MNGLRACGGLAKHQHLTRCVIDDEASDFADGVRAAVAVLPPA